MVIAVEKNLLTLADALRNMGFEVVEYKKYQYPIDALVYSGGVVHLESDIAQSAGKYGIFMVNANGKTAEEIAEILRRRTYSPLF